MNSKLLLIIHIGCFKYSYWYIEVICICWLLIFYSLHTLKIILSKLWIFFCIYLRNFFLTKVFFVLLNSKLPIFSLLVCPLLLCDILQTTVIFFFSLHYCFQCFCFVSLLMMISKVIITYKCISFSSYCYFVSDLNHK